MTGTAATPFKIAQSSPPVGEYREGIRSCQAKSLKNSFSTLKKIEVIFCHAGQHTPLVSESCPRYIIILDLTDIAGDRAILRFPAPFPLPAALQARMCDTLGISDTKRRPPAQKRGAA